MQHHEALATKLRDLNARCLWQEEVDQVGYVSMFQYVLDNGLQHRIVLEYVDSNDELQGWDVFKPAPGNKILDALAWFHDM